MIVVGLVAVAGAIAVREFIVLAGPFFMGGLYLVLNGVGLAFMRPKPLPADAAPLELQVTSRDSLVYRVGIWAMFAGIASAPFAFFLRGTFVTILQLCIAVFVIALVFASRNIRCPKCGSPLPFELARQAVRTTVASWRPVCPRCRAQI
ncbi:MAG: hypothetical protein WD826_05040 [Actinomycetota bacterium]